MISSPVLWVVGLWILAVDTKAAVLQGRAPRADTAESMKQKTWNPPKNLVGALNAVWNHTMQTYSPRPDPMRFPNYGFNQVIANKGHINYCVRWDSKRVADPTLRKRIDSVLKVQAKKWMDILVGFEGWPYREVPVRIVGWASRNQSLFPQLDAAREGRFYSDRDREGIPQCSEKCGRFFHQDGKYPACPGGPDMHYDMSLWLTDDFRGGHGGDWGQRLGTQPFISALGVKDMHIYLHETVRHGTLFCAALG
jgi:hypothetical protein